MNNVNKNKKIYKIKEKIFNYLQRKKDFSPLVEQYNNYIVVYNLDFPRIRIINNGCIEFY